MPIQSETEKAFITQYVINGTPYGEAVKVLSNSELSEELRWVTDLSRTKDAPDWFVSMYNEQRDQILALIDARTSNTNAYDYTMGHIEQYNEEYTISQILRIRGVSRAYPGRTVKCPAHDDRSPSLSISKDDGRGYCFNVACALNNDGYGVDPFALNKILTELLGN